ncbi:MAG: xylulokinase [Bacteroidota bacterium]
MATGACLLGFDVGSSSVKVSVIEAATGKLVASAISPTNEMEIGSPQPGWAEQHPEMWWQHATEAVRKALQTGAVGKEKVAAIGISYQMHGLVLVDEKQQVLRPSIIWCDSRAVDIGEQASRALGEQYCLTHLLNSPGNFTASKLRWVKENESDVYKRINKIMLPGDYLAMRLTGAVRTTVSGLSEGIFWDYQTGTVSDRLLQLYGIDPKLLADTVPTFGNQGELTPSAAETLGLLAGTPVTYRAGDQPNNAFSLKALHPGEVAATAGTSGVIYAITDKPQYDGASRVNPFVHVNHEPGAQRLGILLCVNGTGIMNSWLRKTWSRSEDLSYEQLNALAASVPIGADGLRILPFGNGAERMLKNRDLGASMHGLNLTRHQSAHVSRAVQEGIVFALGYGFDILHEIGVHTTVIRAGRANMFLSDLFCEAFANVTGARLELYNTDGAQGAARAAGVGAGIYANHEEAFVGLERIGTFEPTKDKQRQYDQAFADWKNILIHQLIPH